jgi:hypothetical protein
MYNRGDKNTSNRDDIPESSVKTTQKGRLTNELVN